MKTYFLPVLMTNVFAIAVFVIYDIARFITEKVGAGERTLDPRDRP